MDGKIYAQQNKILNLWLEICTKGELEKRVGSDRQQNRIRNLWLKIGTKGASGKRVSSDGVRDFDVNTSVIYLWNRLHPPSRMSYFY